MTTRAPSDHKALLQEVAAAAADVGGLDAPTLSAIVAALPVFLALTDPDGRLLWVNRTVPSLPREDLLGTTVYDHLIPEDARLAREARERVVETKQPTSYLAFGPGVRGPRSRYQNWLAPILVADRVVAVIAIARDVSEEWEPYDALRDREQRLSLVLDAAGMGTWRFHFASKTVELDERARKIYGAVAARLDSMTFTTTHIHPDDRAAADASALASARDRRPYAAENRILRTDGTVRWVAITGSPIVDENDAVVALMGTITDITERRELEAKAREAQKLEAVGQLTAGIAHNFNNVLAAIMPTLTLIEPEVAPRSVPLVQGAAQAATRAAELVRQLMTFSGRNRPHDRTREQPHALIDRTLRLCRSTFDRSIEVRVEVAPDLPAIHVDVGQIEQALLNLLLNARDAVLESGRVDPVVSVRADLVTDPAAPGGAWLAIAIEDNGPGVPEDVRGRVFEPFFTTKVVGRGTGLGLSTAYAIAREHDGSLRYAAGPSGGACFTLLLPASRA